MELRDVLRGYRGYWPAIFGGSLIIGFIAAGISYYLPPQYRASLTLYVTHAGQTANDKFYNYDGYYAQQAAERYGQTVVGLIKDTAVVKQAAALSGLPFDDAEIKNLQRAIQVRETAPQLIRLTVTGREREGLGRLTISLAEVTAEKVWILNKSGDDKLAVSLLENTPTWETVNYYPWLNGLVAFLAGFAAITLAVYFYHYLFD